MSRRARPGIRIRVAGLLLKGKQVLLVKHRKPGREYWLLPGGGVEYAETLAQALVREFREETGYRIKVNRLLQVSDAIPPDRHRHILNLFFIVRVIGGRLSPVREKVLQGARFFTTKELSNIKIYPTFLKRFLLQAIGSKGKIRALLYTANTWVD